MKEEKWLNAKILFFLLTFFLIMVFAGGECFSAEENAAKGLSSDRTESAEINWLIFSTTEYQHERELVKKYEHVTMKESKEGQIYIALADLNDDGVNEIFAYIDIFEFCGKMGCTFGIYQIRNNKLASLFGPEFGIGGFPIFIDVDKAGRQKVIGLLQTKTMGWKDITLEGKAVWKWNGKNY